MGLGGTPDIRGMMALGGVKATFPAVVRREWRDREMLKDKHARAALCIYAMHLNIFVRGRQRKDVVYHTVASLSLSAPAADARRVSYFVPSAYTRGKFKVLARTLLI